MKQIALLIVILSIWSGANGQTSKPDPGRGTTVKTDERDPKTPSQDVSNPSNSTPAYVRPDAATRRKRYINSLVGPWALGRQVAKAGISTWRNSPEEWGTKWEGFGRRLASNFGKNAIKQTTKFGLDEALKYDSHFYRSRNKSTGARIRNALISPVTARNEEGKRVIGIPNIVATYSSNIISREAWYPDRYTWKNGVRSGTFSLGFNAAFNLFKEFVWKK